MNYNWDPFSSVHMLNMDNHNSTSSSSTTGNALGSVTGNRSRSHTASGIGGGVGGFVGNHHYHHHHHHGGAAVGGQGHYNSNQEQQMLNMMINSVVLTDDDIDHFLPGSLLDEPATSGAPPLRRSMTMPVGDFHHSSSTLFPGSGSPLRVVQSPLYSVSSSISSSNEFGEDFLLDGLLTAQASFLAAQQQSWQKNTPASVVAAAGVQQQQQQQQQQPVPITANTNISTTSSTSVKVPVPQQQQQQQQPSSNTTTSNSSNGKSKTKVAPHSSSTSTTTTAAAAVSNTTNSKKINATSSANTGGSSSSNSNNSIISSTTSTSTTTTTNTTGSSSTISDRARDPKGSRQLQREMERADKMDNEAEKKRMIQEICPYVLTLAFDPFGNYCIQCFLTCSHGGENAELIANELRTRLRELASDQHGCRVIQKILEVSDIGTRNLWILRELLSTSETEMIIDSDWVRMAARDNCATFVLQRAVDTIWGVLNNNPQGNLVLQETLENICLELLPYVEDLAKDKLGTKVIQGVLGKKPPSPNVRRAPSLVKVRQKIVDSILASLEQLGVDQHGNFVLQHLIVNGTNSERDLVMKHVNREVSLLARHKFGSHLVEKSIASCSSQELVAMIAVLLPGWKNLVADPFGNYVAKRIIERFAQVGASGNSAVEKEFWSVVSNKV